jgi:outer membrane protein TolC
MKMSHTLRPGSGARLGFAVAALTLACALPGAGAQISLATAVDLALRTSPRVKSAEADVSRARAVLDQGKDIYIPSLSAGAGLGQAYGYSNYPPTLFQMNSTSVIYSAAQFNYVRSARAGIDAAQDTLQDMRETVAEDAALTFVALDRDQQREQVLAQQTGYAGKLLSIVQDRFDAGLDTRMDLHNAQLTVANLRVSSLRAQQDTDNDRNHLSRLIGLPPGALRAAEGFPKEPITAPNTASTEGYANASVAAAFASARAKQQQAYGDSHFLYRPQVSFVAQYNRYATFTNSWHNIEKEYCDPLSSGSCTTSIGANEEFFGLQINIPLFDRFRKAKGRETTAEAAKSLHDAETAQVNVLDAQSRLNHTIELMQAQSDVASLQQQLAQDQLEIVQAQLANAQSSPQPMTPKDEQNSRINEREKYLAVLDATFQLHQAQISYLRQTGHLEDWLLHAGLPPAPAAPSTLQPHP